MSSMKTVSINDVLSIIGRGLEIRSDEMIDPSDMKKIKKIAKLLDVKPSSWENLSEAVAQALEPFISRNAEDIIYIYGINDPTRYETGYEVRVYRIGDKYVVYYQEYTPDILYEKYIVTNSLKSALKKAIDFLDFIIDEIASVYDVAVPENLYKDADYAIAEVKDEIKRLREQLKQL